MVQKRPERRKKSRARTEKREKYADDRPGSVRERSRADRCPPRRGAGSPPAGSDPPGRICYFLGEIEEKREERREMRAERRETTGKRREVKRREMQERSEKEERKTESRQAVHQ